jgi:hypothetical protein
MNLRTTSLRSSESPTNSRLQKARLVARETSSRAFWPRRPVARWRKPLTTPAKAARPGFRRRPGAALLWPPRNSRQIFATTDCQCPWGFVASPRSLWELRKLKPRANAGFSFWAKGADPIARRKLVSSGSGVSSGINGKSATSRRTNADPLPIARGDGEQLGS